LAYGVRLLPPAVTRKELLTQTVLAVCHSLHASPDERAAVLAALGNADA